MLYVSYRIVIGKYICNVSINSQEKLSLYLLMIKAARDRRVEHAQDSPRRSSGGTTAEAQSRVVVQFPTLPSDTWSSYSRPVQERLVGDLPSPPPPMRDVAPRHNLTRQDHRFPKGEICGLCAKNISIFGQTYKCSSCQAVFHSKCRDEAKKSVCRRGLKSTGMYPFPSTLVNFSFLISFSFSFLKSELSKGPVARAYAGNMDTKMR
jgi:hypothetical protein